MFFGRDLLKSQPGEGRAFLNHNRDIGLLTRDRLVVLGLKQTVEFYQGDPKVVEMSLLTQPTDADREIEKDAIAIYQVADDLYMHRRYRIDGELLRSGRQDAAPLSSHSRMICFTASVTIRLTRSGVRSARLRVEKLTLRSTPRPAG